MNREEAKEILLPYRHRAGDADDPQIAEALRLAKSDPELGRWLEEHGAKQNILREKFQQIAVPEGLVQQIISERAAAKRASFLERHRLVAAVVAITVIVVVGLYAWEQMPKTDYRLITYQSQMEYVALSGYALSLATNDPAQIRDYLKQNGAPSDFTLPEPLKQVALTGCTVENFEGRNVSMICFHTGSKSSDPHVSDLWLFVTDRKAVTGAPKDATPQIAKVGRLATATWTEGDKLYVLGQQGDVQSLQKFL
jgi:hypothetical protein